MVLILKLFLWIFLLGLCMLAYFALRIFLTVRKAKKEFEAMTGGKGGFGGQGANGSQGANGGFGNGNGGFGSGNGPAGQTTTTSHGDQITDTRNPEKAHRKAISDDEGEYIDFVEED